MRDTHHEDHLDDDNNRGKNDNGKDVDIEMDFAPFWTFFDKFVPWVAGVKVWSVKR